MSPELYNCIIHDPHIVNSEEPASKLSRYVIVTVFVNVNNANLMRTLNAQNVMP